MNKIICDICGTTYPNSAECCPICGCSNDAAEDLHTEDMPFEDLMEESSVSSVPFSGKNRKKEIFDFDEVNTEDTSEEEYEDEEYDEEEEEEEVPRHNTFVVILLTVLIVALLGVAAFIFLRYFLPNMSKDEVEPTESVIQEMETNAETTDPAIPCQQMFMTNAGVAELSAEGQQFLLHIKAIPENTTDKIVYTSGNESIATVTEDGKITAVAEGETVIYISCGEHFIDCPVIVKYVEETVPPTTEETVPEETAAEEGVSEEEPTGSAVAETTPDTQSGANLKDVTLKLKKTDIQLGVYYSFTLELDCDLNPEDVTWSSEHPHIATVDEKGNVTAVKEGTTSITAKYGDQEAQCLVRCVWF